MRSLDRYEIIGSVIAVIGAGIIFMPRVDTILWNQGYSL
jgi:drug/metabolite transporter superfamily protein YnfA